MGNPYCSGTALTLGWWKTTSALTLLAGLAGYTPGWSYAGQSVCAKSLAGRLSESLPAPLASAELDVLHNSVAD